MDFYEKFQAGLAYDDFLNKFGTPPQIAGWQQYREQIQLSDSQKALLQGFKRQINVLCMAGVWCGDCVQQCPILDVFEKESSCINIAYLDRDEDEELKASLTICGGARVPQVVFLAEDGAFVGHFGDRTLSRYRHMAQTQLGAACPTGITGKDGDPLLNSVVQDWLDEFERIHWILRLSPRLRSIHND